MQQADPLLSFSSLDQRQDSVNYYSKLEFLLKVIIYLQSETIKLAKFGEIEVNPLKK